MFRGLCVCVLLIMCVPNRAVKHFVSPCQRLTGKSPDNLEDLRDLAFDAEEEDDDDCEEENEDEDDDEEDSCKEHDEEDEAEKQEEGAQDDEEEEDSSTEQPSTGSLEEPKSSRED